MFIVMSAWIKIIETLNDVVTHLKFLNIQEQANSVDGKKYGKKSKEGDKKTIQRINRRKVDSLKKKIWLASPSQTNPKKEKT